MYKFTIIIPHKNIPNLLQRCLCSIPKREDLQVIIIDDNSDPGIVDFGNFPGIGEENIEVVFTKEGKGAGYARNIGLKYAKGEWLLFADADDFYNYSIGEILDRHINSSCDIIFFDSCSLDSETYANSFRSAFTHEMIKLYAKNKEEGEFQLRYYLGVPWSKIIKKDLIDKYKIRFDETQITNDNTFSYLCGYYAQKIDVDPVAGYCITTRADSLTFTPLSDEKILNKVDISVRRHKFLSSHGIYLLDKVVPTRLLNLKRLGKTALYNKCVKIINDYGYEEEYFFQNKSWEPHWSYNTDDLSQDFLWSPFGSAMRGVYSHKGRQYVIMLYAYKLMQFLIRIKVALYSFIPSFSNK